MVIPDEIAAFQPELAAWRQDLHAHPELAYEEERTSAFVATRLESFGVEVHRGLAGTGVVGTLRAGRSQRAIGLRADMDALPLDELNGFAHRSRHPGRMHACGHDGHTVMLLAAARHLARHGRFDGSVHLIFQPAEEHHGGGKRMIDEGLFRLFPMEQVFGLHNLPGLPVGSFAVRGGPMLASSDSFEIRVRGRGAHGAFPHQAVDPVPIAAEIVLALQQVVSRNLDPLESAVLSVTRIEGGTAANVIPEAVRLSGTMRAFLPRTRDLLERRLREIAGGIASVHGAAADIEVEHLYPPTINDAASADEAADAAADIVGMANVRRNHPPSMAADDIAFMLREKPGAHVLIGNGDGEGSCMVHNPHYDFNDAILGLGAAFWTRLVERQLAIRI